MYHRNPFYILLNLTHSSLSPYTIARNETSIVTYPRSTVTYILGLVGLNVEWRGVVK